MAAPLGSSDRHLRTLVVAADRSLEDEYASALSMSLDRQSIVYSATTYREAVDQARRRQPDLVIVDVDRDVDEIVGLLRDVREVSPESLFAAAFRPDHIERSPAEGDAFISLLRADVRDFVRRPLATTELREVTERLFARRTATTAAVHGRVAAFISNKGGVGKSTLAVNVACGLAVRFPDEVLLIDTSLQVGTCGFMLDLKPTTSIVDAVRERDRLDRTLLRHLALRHPSGVRLLAAPADALEASEVDDEAVSRIVNMARHSFKYVIIDTFPMLDNVLMATLDVADVAYVVMQGTAPSVAAISRLLPMLEGLGLPVSRQRLVLNHNYPPFLGDLRPGDVADQLQRTVEHVLPYEKRVLVSMNTGTPEILRASRWQRFSRAAQQIVNEVAELAPAATGREAGVDPAGQTRLRTNDQSEARRA